MKKPFRKLIVVLIVISISSLVPCLALEIILRLAGVESFGKTGKLFIWPPLLNREFIPKPGVLYGMADKSLFSVNSNGIRGAEFSEKSKNQRHILAIGGSTTECLYLDNKSSWPSLLEKKLSGTWVGSVGKSGRSSEQHVLDLEFLLPQFPQIDTVLLLVGVNDLLKRLMFGANVEYEPTELRVPELKSQLIKKSFFRAIPVDHFFNCFWIILI
jgi:hypothetical protein